MVCLFLLLVSWGWWCCFYLYPVVFVGVFKDGGGVFAGGVLGDDGVVSIVGVFGDGDVVSVVGVLGVLLFLFMVFWGILLFWLLFWGMVVSFLLLVFSG